MDRDKIKRKERGGERREEDFDKLKSDDTQRRERRYKENR